MSQPVGSVALTLSYAGEIKRKALHLLALAMPLGTVMLGQEAALWILTPIALCAVALDVGRLRIGWMHRFFDATFGHMMRPEERPALGGPIYLNGATWMCVAAALCAWLFPPGIAAAAQIMLQLGDGAAALIGRRYGRTRFPGSPKSLEGSLSFFVTALLCALPLALLHVSWFALPGTPLDALHQPAFSLVVLVVGAAVAAVAEALPLPFNDNVAVPLLAGTVMLAAQSAGL